MPQRFFRARPLFGGKKSKILENRVGKIAFYKVQGHILGLFARFGTRFFFSIFFREIRIFSRKKIPDFLKNQPISRGKVPQNYEVPATVSPAAQPQRGSVCTALRAPCFLRYGGTGEGETSEPASAGALLAGGERGAPRPSHTARIGERLRRFPQCF